MDVGDPSNLTRIIHLYGGDLDHLRRDVSAFSATDADTRRCIREVFDATGRILDPHTAVGYLGLEHANSPSGERPPTPSSSPPPTRPNSARSSNR